MEALVVGARLPRDVVVDVEERSLGIYARAVSSRADDVIRADGRGRRAGRAEQGRGSHQSGDQRLAFPVIVGTQSPFSFQRFLLADASRP